MGFYVLEPWRSNLFNTKYTFAEIVDPQNVGDPKVTGVCPKCGTGLGRRPWIPPHYAKLSKAVYPDLLWGAGFDLLVSDSFVSAYQKAHLSGIFQIDPPVEILKVGRQSIGTVQPPPPQYHNILYVHDGVDLDDVLSHVKRLSGLCEYCRQGISALRRVVLRENTWDGSDIFGALGLPGTMIVTERFKALVENNRFESGQFVAAESYRFDFARIPHRY